MVGTGLGLVLGELIWGGVVVGSVGLIGSWEGLYDNVSGGTFGPIPGIFALSPFRCCHINLSSIPPPLPGNIGISITFGLFITPSKPL